MSNVTDAIEEEETFDPNANVPTWVNIVVPIGGAVLFLLVLWFLYKTKKEVPVEKLENFVQCIPLINKYLTTEWMEDDADDIKKPPKDTTSGQEKNGVLGNVNPVFTVEDCKTPDMNGTGGDVNRRHIGGGIQPSVTLFDTRL